MKLVIFDFDGTLADTRPIILASYSAAIHSMGLPERPAADCQATIGLPLEVGFRQLYPDAPASVIEEATVSCRRHFEVLKPLYPPVLFSGVKATLEELHKRGVMMSIASSRSSKSLEELCCQMCIRPYFSLLLGADSVSRAKPDPEPVNLTLFTLGIAPADALVVGDMPADIAMGRGAGCFTVGVDYGNASSADLRAAQADTIISSFTQLLNLPSLS